MEVVEKTEQEKKEEEPEKAVDPQVQAIFDGLNQEANINWTTEFQKTVKSSEWQLPKLDGSYQICHYMLQGRKSISKLRQLQTEKIDDTEDFDKYSENYKQRAMLLIKEIKDNPDLFDELEFYPAENLVMAWSVRSNRGFHKREQGV